MGCPRPCVGRALWGEAVWVVGDAGGGGAREEGGTEEGERGGSRGRSWGGGGRGGEGGEEGEQGCGRTRQSTSARTTFSRHFAWREEQNAKQHTRLKLC